VFAHRRKAGVPERSGHFIDPVVQTITGPHNYAACGAFDATIPHLPAKRRLCRATFYFFILQANKEIYLFGHPESCKMHKHENHYPAPACICA